MPHDPLTLAYLAGAIDADGHITVTRSLRKIGKRYSHSPTYYHPKIGYTSIDETVPLFLRQTFGGAIHRHQPKNAAHRLVHIWSITTAASGAVAEALIPHLRMKRHQAELLAELCALITEQHADQQRTQKPPYRITPEQLAERERLWEEATVLNNPRNRRVHHLGKKSAGRLLDGVEHNGFPATDAQARAAA